ncbi:MAG: DMT family transporter [Candidatus Pelagibacterales bacterium]|jgi:drug/metabolite transporter (DMT)-like permease|tara:strand:+ start:297 stop:1172 length:876 start_codon:yes stop_codon:yes gene_type:complete
MKYNNQTLGTLALLFAGVFLSFGGTLIQYMDSATAIEITTFRSITFSLIMLLYILVKFKRKTPQAFKAIGKSGILIGFIIGISNICYVFGMSNTSVANGGFILSTGPLFAALASYFFLKKKISLKTLIAIGGSMFGVGVMFSGGIQASHAIGNLIMLLVPICFAFQLTLINRSPEIDFMPATFLGGIVAFLIGFSFIGEYTINNHDLMIALFIGAFQVGIGFILITIGSRYIPPHRAALFILTEPILTPIWAWVFLGHQPPAIELIGGLIIFLFVVFRLIDQFFEVENKTQ